MGSWKAAESQIAGGQLRITRAYRFDTLRSPLLPARGGNGKADEQQIGLSHE
jgi:hypothetical protein